VTKEYPKELDVVRAANERLELAALPPVAPGQPAATAPETSDGRKPQGDRKK
jgi:hypothetical protein